MEYDDDEVDLDPYERHARRLLTPVLGPLRVTDVRGSGKEGQHDFEADCADGSIAALEVTSTANGARNSLAQEIRQRLSGLRKEESYFSWTVSLTEDARVRQITPENIYSILEFMENANIRDSHRIGDWLHPVVARLRDLGIWSIHAIDSSPGSEGYVYVLPAPYGGWGWDSQGIDEWLGALLNSKKGQNKINKLARASAVERHLVIVLDPTSQEGLSIPLASVARHERGVPEHGIPSLVPPEPLTHLWILPPVESWDVLSWSRAEGWSAGRL